MAIRDSVSGQYFHDKARAAELLNVGLLGGSRLIKPEDIEEVDSVVFETAPDTGSQREKHKINKKLRDIQYKLVCGCCVMFVGIENQDEIHYAMPIRAMGYDFSRYQTQYEEIKKWHKQQKDLKKGAEFLSGFSSTDRLNALFTVIVYFGEEPWTGPLSLKEMLDMKDIPEKLRQFVNDYPLHVIDVTRMEHTELLETDLKLVFGWLQRRSQMNELRQFVAHHKEEFQNLAADAYDMIAVYSDTQGLAELKNIATTEEQGGVNMCKALDEWARIAREEGRKEGCKAMEEWAKIAREEGRKEGCKAMEERAKIAREEGRKEGIRIFILDNVEEGKTARQIQEKLMRSFQLSAELAEQYYLQYAEG